MWKFTYIELSPSLCRYSISKKYNRPHLAESYNITTWSASCHPLRVFRDDHQVGRGRAAFCRPESTSSVRLRFRFTPWGLWGKGGLGSRFKTGSSLVVVCPGTYVISYLGLFDRCTMWIDFETACCSFVPEVRRLVARRRGGPPPGAPGAATGGPHGFQVHPLMLCGEVA